MKIREIETALGLEILTPELEGERDKEVSTGHASDLLSDVLAHAKPGSVLVTLQTNMNLVAVSLHAGLAAVIFSSDRVPDAPVRKKAVEERILLYRSAEPAFDIVGRLYALGLRG